MGKDTEQIKFWLTPMQIRLLRVWAKKRGVTLSAAAETLLRMGLYLDAHATGSADPVESAESAERRESATRDSLDPQRPGGP